jgi:hypothetical protein
MTDDPLDEARGLSIASTSLCFALVTLLFNKGIIQRADMDDFFESVLESLETDLTPTDPAARIARSIIDSMAQVAATGGESAPKADRS